MTNDIEEEFRRGKIENGISGTRKMLAGSNIPYDRTILYWVGEAEWLLFLVRDLQAQMKPNDPEHFKSLREERDWWAKCSGEWTDARNKILVELQAARAVVEAAQNLERNAHTSYSDSVSWVMSFPHSVWDDFEQALATYRALQEKGNA